MWKRVGDEHPHTLASMNNLALTLRAQGDRDGARALEAEVEEIRARALSEVKRGPTPPPT